MPATPSPSATARLSAARLAAVQALYQISMTGGDVPTVLREFKALRPGSEHDEPAMVEPDTDLFQAIVRGCVSRKADVERVVAGASAGERSLDRAERLLRVIVEAATWELLENGDVPARVLLSDYVDVAHAFFDGREPAIVNAVLDRIAHVLRPEDVAAMRDRS